MTRFARAKGSKASNERVPEEATTWVDMKKQLEQKQQEAEFEKNRQKIDAEREENYQKFLKETEDKQETAWADFPAATITSKVKKVKQSKKDNVKKAKKKSGEEICEMDAVKQSKNKGGEEEINGNHDVEANVEGHTKKKKEKKKVGSPQDNSECHNEGLIEGKELTVENDKPIIVSSGKKRKMEKKKAKNLLEKKPTEEMTAQELELYNKKKAKMARQKERRKMFKKQKKEAEKRYRELNNIPPNEPSKSGNQNFNNNKRKNDGKGNDQHKRRKPDSQVKSITINGQEKELAYVDGFPIKKEDALRLSELKKQMISKGLPKSQVNIALKIERRKAEKALAREKKTTCFNCRQSGHNLSDCPKLNDNNSIQTVASGICYKCGSTEHTQFQCKAVKNPEFRFATCFICNEQGHLSRQCPDNARGMYPNGGACNLCGDVTHLRKDCPTHVAKQEASNISLNRMNGSNIEGLDDEIKTTKPVARQKVNKVIKFD